MNYPIILGENTVGTDTYGYVGIKGKNNSQLYLTADQDASGSTRLDYLDTQNNAHLVALTSDGYTFAGDTGTANTLALNSTLRITGGIDQTENLTLGNIGVVSSGNGGLTVQLAKSLTGLTDATFNSGSAQTKIDASGVTAPAYQVGTKTYIDSDGLHANDQKVTGVKAGTLDADSTDAVNGSQLFATNQNVTKNAGNITDLTARLDGAGMTFAGDSGTPVNKKLNETLTLTGGETSIDSLTQLSDKNIGLVADTDGKLEVRLAKDLTGLTGAVFSNGNFTTQLTGNGLTITPTSSGNAVTLTAQNLDLGGRQLHGVQAGEVTATSTDAGERQPAPYGERNCRKCPGGSPETFHRQRIRECGRGAFGQYGRLQELHREPERYGDPGHKRNGHHPGWNEGDCFLWLWDLCSDRGRDNWRHHRFFPPGQRQCTGRERGCREYPSEQYGGCSP